MVDINILVVLPVLHLPCFLHFLVSSVRYKQRKELIAIANEGIIRHKTCSAAPEDVSIYKPILPAYILPRTKKGNQQETLDKITDRRLITNTFLRSFSINVLDEKKAMQNCIFIELTVHAVSPLLPLVLMTAYVLKFTFARTMARVPVILGVRRWDAHAADKMHTYTQTNTQCLFI